MDMVVKFQKVAPDWDGKPVTPTVFVELMLQVIEKFTSAEAGTLVSQFGDKNML